MSDAELRALDAEIHREVFGIHAEWNEEKKDAVAAFHPRMGWLISIPRYSSDIAAAWLVVEKMRKNGCSCVLSNETRPHALFTGETLVGDWKYADTAPLAICLAALQTVRSKP